MRLAVIALTFKGSLLAKRLASGLVGHLAEDRGWPYTIHIFIPERFLSSLFSSLGEASARVEVRGMAFDVLASSENGAPGRPSNLSSLFCELFGYYNGVICIMAAGIVVRMIAPHLKNKAADPAVVVVDEEGRWSISLVSGHLGGANDLARLVAQVIGAEAVITTASDVAGLPAFDTLARDMGWVAEPPDALRRVAASVVNGQRVDVYADCDPEYIRRLLQRRARDMGGVMVQGMGEWRGEPGGAAALVFVTNRYGIPFVLEGNKPIDMPVLFLRPRNVVAGVGCRKGAPGELIVQAVEKAFETAGLARSSLRALATVDFKGGEPGIRLAAQRLGVPLVTVEREEIESLERTGGFAPSVTVRRRVGVGGVCEPAALLGCTKGRNNPLLPRLALPKTVFPQIPGVTVALAVEQDDLPC